MPSVCAAADFVCIRQTETAASGDIDAVLGTGDEAREYVGAGEYVRCASGGEDAMAAGRDDIFESAIEVGYLVKRSMKGDFHRRGELYQSASACRIHGAVRIQYTEDDTARSKALCVLKLGADGGEVGCGVDESISVRAQKYMHRKATALNRPLGKFMTWRETANIQHGTEFDAVRAAWLGRQGGIESLSA
jgi:hypothetical protein